jgi:hypothetical protein
MCQNLSRVSAPLSIRLSAVCSDRLEFFDTDRDASPVVSVDEATRFF